MSASDTLYAARFDLPELIERGRNNTVRCTVYRSGAVVAPSAGSVAVYDEGNTLVWSSSVSISGGGVAFATVTSATLAGKTYSDQWRIVWSLVMPDGTTRTFDNECMLVRRALFPVVTEADLYRIASSLDPAGNACIHSETSFASKLDEAWIQIQGRLLSKGNRPNLILSPTALRDPHLYLTLALIFEDFSTRLNPAYAGIAMQYRGHWNDSYAQVRFLEADSSDDGTPSSSARKGPYVSTLWLSSGGRAPWRW